MDSLSFVTRQAALIQSQPQKVVQLQAQDELRWHVKPADDRCLVVIRTVPLELHHKGRRITVNALVDDGST